MSALFRHFRRMVLGAAITAIAMTAAVVVTQAYLLVRYAMAKRRGSPGGPAAGLEATGEKSMEEIAERLERVPFNPVRPMALGFAKAGLNHSYLLLANAQRSTAGRMYRYPRDFEESVIESFDGTPIKVVVGVHSDGRRRPGLVISHGFMGSKNDHYIIDTALRAFAEWGFNVLGIDLRNFGGSQCIGHTPTTAGWKEGEDLLAAARYLSGKPEVTTVGITGFSMGAGSTMRAAYMAREYPYLTGGAIAWNGYSDAARMVRYISDKPPLGEPFYPVHLGFRAMHYLRRRDMKDYIDDPELAAYLGGNFYEADFASYVERIAAPHYGVTTEEFYSCASSAGYLADVEVPLLVVHAADDPVCPPDEMDCLIEVARENPNVEVWMMPAGSHCLFRYLDKNWYDSVMRGYFSYWAEWD
jgi:uncharacterized protein